jgi:hypothetical protein
MAHRRTTDLAVGFGKSEPEWLFFSNLFSKRIHDAELSFHFESVH